MDSTRCFAAVPIKPPADREVRNFLKRLQKQVPNLRASTEETLHITTKFIGDVPTLELMKVCDAVSEVASHSQHFNIELSRLGVFPHLESPRVLWMGIQNGSEELHRVHCNLEDRLSSLGIAREARKFTPHLTLGRLTKTQANSTEQASLVHALDAECMTEFIAEDLILYSSTRTRNGYEYDVLHKAKFA